MPQGSMFSDISEGIFGRLNELRAEQTKKDEDKRGQVLNVLTSLIDRVEPESQGVLFGHIGDVMGLKGKEREGWKGIFDRFTGKNQDATERALGSKFQDITGGFVGPETARKARSMAGFTRGFTPSTPEQAANIASYQEGARFPGKMILRDPRAERLEQLKTQYGMQFAQRQALQDDAQAAIAERQKDLANQRDILKRRGQVFDAELRASRELDALAKNIAASKGRPNSVTDADTIEAGNMLMKTYAFDDDLKQALLKLRGAQTTLATTEAAGLATGGSMTAGQSRQETATRNLQGEVQKNYGEYQRALTEVDSKRKMLLNLQGRLSEIAKQNKVEFDPTINDFRGDPLDVMMAQFADRKSKMLEQVKKLALDISDAEGRLKGPYDILRRDYSEYIDIDPSGNIKLKPPYSAPRKQGTGAGTPTGSYPGAGARSSRGMQPKTQTQPAPAQKGAPPPPLTMKLGPMNSGVQPSNLAAGSMPPGQATGGAAVGGYTRGRFSSRRLQQGESVKLSDDKWYAVDGIENPDSSDPIYKFRLLPQQ